MKDYDKEVKRIEKMLLKEAKAVQRTKNRWLQGQLGPFTIVEGKLK